MKAVANYLRLLDHIKQSPFIAILVDASTDKFTIDAEVVQLCLMKDCLSILAFADYCHLKKSDAESIFKNV